MFHIIGSTGRTGTNFIAGTLNKLPGVLALHEGHQLNTGEPEQVLPTINLENFAVYKDPSKAGDVVASKRNADILHKAKQTKAASTLIDIAYYNAIMGRAILATHPDARMIGIIRNCYDFVQSAAFREGEDVLAVGWPDPAKPLSPRESFIAMGRLRPLRGSEAYRSWKDWGTIERNIWLWKTTNLFLLETLSHYPDRMNILSFEKLKTAPGIFWGELLPVLNLPSDTETIDSLVSSTAHQNRKPTGYQIGERSSWTSNQIEMLESAQLQINTKWNTHDK